MSINSIETVTTYSNELDKLFVSKSATGFFTDNAFGAKFVGAKTVMIPDIDFQGLADYDRDTGFSRGAITVANTSYTMKMDRARSLQIDREDLDEAGIAKLAGGILGEYVRTKVVPECDAYVISKLAGLAMSRSNTIEGDTEKPFASLCALIEQVQAVVGYDEELVAFIDSCLYAKLNNSTEIAHMINVADFKQGEVNLKVKSLNGVALIPVVSERMKTAYRFYADEKGGFAPEDKAREVYMMVCPKNGAHLVKKTEKMRVFTPEQNLDADAYKFDYRVYYDVFVKNSGLDGIWAWVSPEVNITAQPADVTVTEGNITQSLKVTATSAEGATLSYQWYACNANGTGAVKIKNECNSQMALDDELGKGTYYYFVKVIIDSLASVNSEIATVTVV